MNVEALRKEFPFLGRGYAYLDNACMTLKPRPVLEAMRAYYEETATCAGRAVYGLAREVADGVEATRAAVRALLHVPASSAFFFTRNTTEGVNLVAHALRWRPGDVILTTDREHNSNLVPWQRAAMRNGGKHRVVPGGPDGRFDLAALDRALREEKGRARIVAMVHQRNLDGHTLPVRDICRAAHDAGALVLLDGAQAAGHRPVDLASIGADYYAFSFHKMMGPTGMGGLVVSERGLAELDAFMVGGETVEDSTYEGHTLKAPAARFEAGLQDYAGILGAGAAVRFLEKVGPSTIEAHERALNERITTRLAAEPRIRILGPPEPAERGGIVSFTVKGLDPHEVALAMDEGHRILVRSGKHCCNSWFNAHGLPGSARASTYLYNTAEEAERFSEALLLLVRSVP